MHFGRTHACRDEVVLFHRTIHQSIEGGLFYLKQKADSKSLQL